MLFQFYRRGPKKPLILALLTLVCLTRAAAAESLSTPVVAPEALTPGLKHLLALVGSRPTPEFEPARIRPLMAFITAEKPEATVISVPRETGQPSAYYQVIIRRSLKSIIAYAFSPDIPLVATVPSSARIVRWMSVADGKAAPPRLGRMLEKLSTPILVHGREYVVNTPDQFSGAYYEYEVDRSLILCRYQQRKALISISRQAGLSGPGRKGLVLGRDTDWDYFYSPEIGLNLKGLGWMRSHMFDSYGVNIYIEATEGSPETILAAFKWVRAGWNKINVVRDRHVHSGLQRFGATFKRILESPLLPEPNELASALSPIKSLNHGRLRAKMDVYRDLLARRHADVLTSGSGWPSRVFRDPQYWSSLSDEEMQSVLVVEKMKQILTNSTTDLSARLLEFNP